MGRQGDCNVVKRKDNWRKEDNKVHQVSPTAELADHTDSHSFLWFESRKWIFDEIILSFQDDNISSVGLYGMGGAGKTTFAKQVGKRAYDLEMFKLVVFVHVGNRHPSMVGKLIKGSIAKQLGLMTSSEDDYSKLIGRQIWERLSKHQPVLVILDDLRTPVKPEKIGIWKGHNRTACKLLITSPNENVGYSIGIECSYHLYLLSESEAFDLLRKRAGLVDGSPHVITQVARRAAGLCDGVPLFLSLAGSALSEENIGQWIQLIQTMPSYWTRVVDSILEDSDFPYGILKFIIDLSTNSVPSINAAAAKTLFSICGFFPPGQEIALEDLSLFAVKLGLCSKHEEAIATINTLKKFDLLMQADQSSDRVIMHDLVHEVAVKLVCKENPNYEDSIQEYIDELYDGDEDFQWKQELEVLLIQLYGVTEYNPPPSSSFSGDPGLQILPSNPYIASPGAAATIPKPSGKLLNFKEGGCVVDKSFLPLLKEACKQNPQLIECQRTHSEILKQAAFHNLGSLLFLLHNVVLKDWVHHKQELQLFWEQTMAMKFDLDWLKPTINRISSLPEFARIEALREEERQLNEEAAKLRERLKFVENKAAVIRTEIEREESMLNGFAIAHVSNSQVVSKANTSLLRKVFHRK